ncbi:MAG: PstS family phosphate ABC transporter substrate-binding protein [Planctomycetes bacterium]|nr:PstS family phosphate ABC transporter substrate-binding protein [Planctomycetota bacterium]
MSVLRRRALSCWVVAATLFGAVSGCQGAADGGRQSLDGNGGMLSGKVTIDGSSTVYPIMEAVAEEFQAAYPNVRVTVGIAGTGGGFKKFAAGEIDIADASRPIGEPEKQACGARGIDYLEFKIANDGLAVVANPRNDWVDCLTVAQLKQLWQPDSKVQKWCDLDPKWPAQPIKLYGPGTDSGTFDYFTEAIVGQQKASRPDYTASEDDNVLVTGIAADKYALGYFGYAYYAENQSKLKLLGVDSGEGCIRPSAETVRGGKYKPLARPLLMYVKKSSLARPEVAAFVRFALSNAEQHC